MTDDTRNNGPKTAKPMPPVEHQFKPGNPGRPKGSRNKLGEQFIADLYADWQEHGVETIARVRDQKPEQYLKVVASILPKDLNVNINSLENMTDEQLIERVRDLHDAIGPLLAAAGTCGADAGDRPETAH